MIKIEVYGSAAEIAAEMKALIGNLTGSASPSTAAEATAAACTHGTAFVKTSSPDGVQVVQEVIPLEAVVEQTEQPNPVEEKPADPPKRGRGRPPKVKPAEEKAPLISTEPENRVDPAAEDDAETAAQDEADEIAEAAAKAPAEKALTHDDLRQAMGNYVKAFGMPAAQEDGPKIFEKALGPVPDGTKDAKGETVTSWKVSAVPADPKALSAAIQFWTAAISENPFQRTRVA